MSNKKVELLEENLKKFISLKEKNVEFVILEVEAREGWDQSTFPPTSYKHIEPWDIPVVTMSCLYKIRIDSHVFQFAHVEVAGILDGSNYYHQYCGLISSEWDDTVVTAGSPYDLYNGDVLWQDQSTSIKNAEIAWNCLNKLGSILMDEQLSLENLGFYKELHFEEEDIKYRWVDLKGHGE